MTEKPTTSDAALSDPASEVVLDTTGLICPEPIMLLHRAIRKLTSGDRVRLLATDPSTQRDVPKFCTHLGHELILQSTQVNQAGTDDGLSFCFVIEKG